MAVGVARAPARARKRGPGRPRGPATPKAAAIARANGRKKPRDKLPEGALTEPPKGDPEKTRAWVIDAMATIVWLDAQGKIGSELATRMRASLSAMERALPTPLPRDDDEPIDDDLEHGPELAESDVDEEPMHG